MITYENECCDCGQGSCSGCPLLEVPHYYCDECDAETQLYEFDGRELCIECIEKLLDPVQDKGLIF